MLRLVRFLLLLISSGCWRTSGRSRRLVSALGLGVLFVVALPLRALAQGAEPPSGGNVFGFEITPARVAFTLLAATICPVVVSFITTLDPKGWQKTALNLGLATLVAIGSWFVDRYGSTQLVIQALSIFMVASGIYFANQGGFRSLTGDLGRK